MDAAAKAAVEAVMMFCKNNPDKMNYICWVMVNQHNAIIYNNAISLVQSAYTKKEGSNNVRVLYDAFHRRGQMLYEKMSIYSKTKSINELERIAIEDADMEFVPPFT